MIRFFCDAQRFFKLSMVSQMKLDYHGKQWIVKRYRLSNPCGDVSFITYKHNFPHGRTF